MRAGELPGARRAYRGDNPAFALMRSERRAIDLKEAHSALPGTLALPMLDQGNLLGFVLLGPRPDGAHYRPDEVQNLTWAAHQVGLDLQALHARELEVLVAKLTERNRSLTEKNALLVTLLENARQATDQA